VSIGHYIHTTNAAELMSFYEQTIYVYCILTPKILRIWQKITK